MRMLLILAGLLVASGARAQDVEAEGAAQLSAPRSAEDRVSRERLVLRRPQAIREDDGEPASPAGRIVAEVFGGAGGYIVGAAGGALTGCMLGVPTGEFGCLIGGVVGGVVGAGFGVALGVYGAGNSAGGNGRFWSAYVGQLVGGLLSLAAIPSLENDDGAVLLVAMTALPLTGAIVGYELSNGPAEAEQAPPPRWTAGIAPTRGGAAVQVGGAF